LESRRLDPTRVSPIRAPTEGLTPSLSVFLWFGQIVAPSKGRRTGQPRSPTGLLLKCSPPAFMYYDVSRRGGARRTLPIGRGLAI